jgi:transcriptional regulator with XRE-family HTH domain
MLVVGNRKVRAGFGVRLREFREASGLTQKDLGEVVGMPPQAIARIEAGSAPSWANAVKLAEALEKSLDDFVLPAADRGEAAG